MTTATTQLNTNTKRPAKTSSRCQQGSFFVGVEQSVARQAHDLEVAGSSPAPANDHTHATASGRKPSWLGPLCRSHRDPISWTARTPFGDERPRMACLSKHSLSARRLPVWRRERRECRANATFTTNQNARKHLRIRSLPNAYSASLAGAIVYNN